MSILMEESRKFIPGLLNGDIIRYGAILKDSHTGKILGHLKETGAMSSLINNLNPISAIADPIGHIATNVQLTHIKQTLSALQMTTNIAAGASLVGLGVSIAGFAIVTRKLNAISATLDNVAADITCIKKSLIKLHKNWDAMSYASIMSAADALLAAENSETEERRVALATEAASSFATLRHYYGSLLCSEGLSSDIELNIDQLNELTSRYIFCCLGLLQAEFLLGDLGSYRHRLNIVTSEIDDLLRFNPKELYLQRCDRREQLSINFDFESQSKSIMSLYESNQESIARINSFETELDYLNDKKISIPEYMDAIKSHDSDIVLFPASG